jgi:hypothetical protein
LSGIILNAQSSEHLKLICQQIIPSVLKIGMQAPFFIDLMIPQIKKPGVDLIGKILLSQHLETGKFKK